MIIDKKHELHFEIDHFFISESFRLYNLAKNNNMVQSSFVDMVEEYGKLNSINVMTKFNIHVQEWFYIFETEDDLLRFLIIKG